MLDVPAKDRRIRFLFFFGSMRDGALRRRDLEATVQEYSVRTGTDCTVRYRVRVT